MGRSINPRRHRTHGDRRLRLIIPEAPPADSDRSPALEAGLATVRHDIARATTLEEVQAAYARGTQMLGAEPHPTVAPAPPRQRSDLLEGLAVATAPLWIPFAFGRALFRLAARAVTTGIRRCG